MKWSAVSALCVLPMALAGSLNSGMVKRTESKQPMAHESPKGNVVVVEETIIIWINAGGESTTVTMGAKMSQTSASPVATHSVIVGGPGGLVYTPETINAAIGDMVIFTFLSQNHTLTQSTFGTPCIKLPGGIDSGFIPNANNTVVPAPQMAVQVTVATPQWFYCKQKTGSHCGKGMTFSINPTAEKTQAQFKQMAIAQNGTGSTAGIVASAPPTAPTDLAASATEAAATGAPPPPAASTVVAPPPAASSIIAAPPPAGSGVTVGTGSNEGGSCSCSCMCGVSSFPSAGIQGRNSYGGVSGAIPMAAMMS